MNLKIEMPEEDLGVGPHVSVVDADAGVPVETPPKSRPSLEVAIEVVEHLRPRVDALCGRLLSWDMRAVDKPTRDAFMGAVRNIDQAMDVLGQRLGELQLAGFEAKTTAKSRKLAKLLPGRQVTLLAPEPWREVYSDAELAAVTVVKTVGDMVWLRAGDRDLGLVPANAVEVES